MADPTEGWVSLEEEPKKVLDTTSWVSLDEPVAKVEAAPAKVEAAPSSDTSNWVSLDSPQQQPDRPQDTRELDILGSLHRGAVNTLGSLADLNKYNPLNPMNVLSGMGDKTKPDAFQEYTRGLMADAPQDVRLGEMQQRVDQEWKDKGAWEGVKQFGKEMADNPSAAANLLIEQVPSMALGMGAGGMFVKTLQGAKLAYKMAGFGASTSAAQTFLSSYATNVADGLKKFGNDEEKAQDYAFTKTLVDAGVNAAAGAALPWNPFKGKLASTALQAGIQGAGGGLGAAGASLSVGEEISPFEVMAEVGGEGAMGIGEFSASSLIAGAKETAARVTPPTPTTPGPSPGTPNPTGGMDAVLDTLLTQPKRTRKPKKTAEAAVSETAETVVEGTPPTTPSAEITSGPTEALQGDVSTPPTDTKEPTVPVTEQGVLIDVLQKILDKKEEETGVPPSLSAEELATVIGNKPLTGEQQTLPGMAYGELTPNDRLALERRSLEEQEQQAREDLAVNQILKDEAAARANEPTPSRATGGGFQESLRLRAGRMSTDPHIGDRAWRNLDNIESFMNRVNPRPVGGAAGTDVGYTSIQATISTSMGKSLAEALRYDPWAYTRLATDPEFFTKTYSQVGPANAIGMRTTGGKSVTAPADKRRVFISTLEENVKRFVETYHGKNKKITPEFEKWLRTFGDEHFEVSVIGGNKGSWVERLVKSGVHFPAVQELATYAYGIWFAYDNKMYTSEDLNRISQLTFWTMPPGASAGGFYVHRPEGAPNPIIKIHFDGYKDSHPVTILDTILHEVGHFLDRYDVFSQLIYSHRYGEDPTTGGTVGDHYNILEQAHGNPLRISSTVLWNDAMDEVVAFVSKAMEDPMNHGLFSEDPTSQAIQESYSKINARLRILDSELNKVKSKSDLNYVKGITKEILSGLNYVLYSYQSSLDRWQFQDAYIQSQKGLGITDDQYRNLLARKQQRAEAFAVLNAIYAAIGSKDMVRLGFPKTAKILRTLHGGVDGISKLFEQNKDKLGHFIYGSDKQRTLYENDWSKLSTAPTTPTSDSEPAKARDAGSGGAAKAKPKPKRRRASLFTKGKKPRVENGRRELTDAEKEYHDIIRNALINSDSPEEFALKLRLSILEPHEVAAVMTKAADLWKNRERIAKRPSLSTPSVGSFDLRTIWEVFKDKSNIAEIGLLWKEIMPSDVAFMGKFKKGTGALIRWVISNVEQTEAMRERAYAELQDLGSTYRTLLKENKKSAAKVMDAFRKSDQISDQLKAQGKMWPDLAWLTDPQGGDLNPLEAQIYQDLTKMYDRSWDFLNITYAKLGRPAPERIPGYFPHAWMGVFKATVQVGKDTYKLSGSTRNELRRKIDAFQAHIRSQYGSTVSFKATENPVMSAHPKASDYVVEIMTTLDSKVLGTTGRQVTRNFLKKVEEGMAGGIITEALERGKVKGYLGEEGWAKLTNNRDRGLFLTTPDRYIHDVSTFLGDTMMAVDVLSQLNDIGQKGAFEQASSLRSYLVNYVLRNTNFGRRTFVDRLIARPALFDASFRIGPLKYDMGYDPKFLQRAISNFNLIFSVVKLFPSVSYYLSNYLQPTYGTITELARVQSELILSGQKGGDISNALVGILTSLPKGLLTEEDIKKWMNNLHPDNKAAVKWAMDNHYIDVRNIDKIDPTNFTDPSSILRRGTDWVMKPSTKLETRGRIISFLVAYKFFEPIYGVGTLKSYSAAKRVMDNSMLNYSPGHSSALLSDYGMMSSIVRPFHTVPTYMLGRLAQTVKNTRLSVAGLAPLVTTLAVSVIFAGLLGAVGIRDVDKIIELLNMTPWFKWKTLTQVIAESGAPDVMLFGLPSSIIDLVPGVESGYNVGGSMGHPNVSEINIPPLMAGGYAALSLLAEIVTGIIGEVPPNISDIMSHARVLMPGIGVTWYENWVQSKTGSVPSSKSISDPVYVRNEAEKIGGYLGVRSLGEEKMKLAHRSIEAQTRHFEEQRNKVLTLVYEYAAGFDIPWFKKDAMDKLNERFQNEDPTLPIQAKDINSFIKDRMERGGSDRELELLKLANSQKDPSRKLFYINQWMNHRSLFEGKSQPDEARQ